MSHELLMVALLVPLSNPLLPSNKNRATRGSEATFRTRQQVAVMGQNAPKCNAAVLPEYNPARFWLLPVAIRNQLTTPISRPKNQPTKQPTIGDVSLVGGYFDGCFSMVATCGYAPLIN